MIMNHKSCFINSKHCRNSKNPLLSSKRFFLIRNKEYECVLFLTVFQHTADWPCRLYKHRPTQKSVKFGIQLLTGRVPADIVGKCKGLLILSEPTHSLKITQCQYFRNVPVKRKVLFTPIFHLRHIGEDDTPFFLARSWGIQISPNLARRHCNGLSVFSCSAFLIFPEGWWHHTQRCRNQR